MLQLQSRKVTNFTGSAAVCNADDKNEVMEEGKRQKQIAGLLNEEMNIIFQRLGLNMIDGGMVSISSVKVTPDLLEARFYLSFFQVKDVKISLQKIEDRHHEIKKELASRIRHQLRSVPVLKFFQDDTLDHVFKMEEIFKKIEQEKPPTPEGE
jgi:ribosome-binding factor A